MRKNHKEQDRGCLKSFKAVEHRRDFRHPLFFIVVRKTQKVHKIISTHT